MALGLLRALAERGRRVPGDISVVGFDDIPEAAYFLPPLTTVRQDFGELGRRALAILVDMIDGRTPPTTCLRISPHLVARASTARPGSADHQFRTGREDDDR
jgi:DNA-binding LacI/PurR family transcriptional regulator